ncbi:hypothetical protein LK994_05495 [Ferruginibacter lapsinanis]|uniref:hypothetical protein n=1 Tax=Ferruginibacter lapsinanis TaxID=563172 RepID=UPI001E37D86A|nr:hypothetical protein [Ferruginibacter lapsinanis]UEG50926.1 hypothetical protein LK994_05495 [Ferruginibacter lapsinanis]
MTKYFPLFLLAFSFQLSAFSQENSPYSRYGVGDMVPNHNILTRGMGGISAGYANGQMLNFTNPASYSSLSSTIFDLGAEVDSRKLKSISPTQNFTATNALFSYMQVGFPIKMKRANKKNIFLGVNIGLKPTSRINYKIAKFERLPGIDSLVTFYEGSGGINEASAGAGLTIKNFSIGFNVGYMFGNKDYSTQLTFLNDTVRYYESNSSTKTNFGGLLLNGGIQYKIKINKNTLLRLGGYGNLKQSLSASKDVLRETVVFDADGSSTKVDSVYENTLKGNLVYPASYGFGFTLQQPNWLFGADLEMTQWKDYRFYDEKDFVHNNWKIRAGAEYFPAKDATSLKKYFNFVKYRAGFYYGPDNVKLTTNIPEYAFTFGAGFPLKLRRSYYETQTSILNVSAEIGSRGDKKSNLRENFFRLAFGFSLSDLWFRRAKYD